MQKTIPFASDRLYCPGPTPIAEHIRAVGGDHAVYHRSQEFFKLFRETRDLLGQFLKTSNEVLILSSSGSGAMEAAALNLTNENDEVLVLNAGKFGDRWSKILTEYSCQCQQMNVDWGESINLELLEKYLQENQGLKGVFFQANETSTGVTFSLDKICALIRKITPNALIVVDAISALGALDIQTDQLGIDCLIGGSQKGLGVPPGLSFLSLSTKAQNRFSKRKKFYFDLKNELSLQITGKTAFTPATSLVSMLRQSLLTLKLFGFDRYVEHHKNLAESLRKSLQNSNLSLFAKENHSNSLTSILIPKDIDGKKLLKTLKEKYLCTFAGGQDQLEGKIIRIAHLGFVDPFHLMSGVACLEMALNEQNSRFVVGKISGEFIKEWHKRSGL